MHNVQLRDLLSRESGTFKFGMARLILNKSIKKKEEIKRYQVDAQKSCLIARQEKQRLCFLEI